MFSPQSFRSQARNFDYKTAGPATKATDVDHSKQIQHLQSMGGCVIYDVAMIGGGVVGCAVLRELTSRGLRCVLCEANSQLVSHASSGNRYFFLL